MIISAKNIVKKYQSGDAELTVLKGLSLDIAEGEFVSVTGRSGSGKSTLLYQLGLLDYPTEGRIQIDSVDVLALSDTERTTFRLHQLGYVFQDYALIPDLTALENVALPLIMQGMSARLAKKEAEWALDRLDLSDKINNLPSQLSGGQQQRVSIARAIAHRPKIIFADEPTANLDSDTSDVVLKAFLELHKEGQTIIMVTHEPEYAALTERVITLSDGEIISDIRNKR